MTTKRWLDEDGEASELERAVLASGLDAEPPEDAERAVWRSLAATLALPPAPGVTEHAGAGAGTAGMAGAGAGAAGAGAGAAKLSGAATLVTLGKGFALGVGVSLAVAGVGRLEAPHTGETKAPVAASSAVPHAPRVAATSRVNPLPELPNGAVTALGAEAPNTANALGRSDLSGKALATSAVPAEPPLVVAGRVAGTASVAAFPLSEGRAASPPSKLEEEAAMLRRARAELHGGRLAAAFATLEASRENFSLPELAQEREALLIELLHRSGERASAVEKARSFLSRYPESPHAAKLRSIASGRP